MKKILTKLTVALFAISLATPGLMANTTSNERNSVSVYTGIDTINDRKVDSYGVLTCAIGQKVTLDRFKVGAIFTKDHDSFKVKITPDVTQSYYRVEITGSDGYSYTSNYFSTATTTTVTNCDPDVTYTVKVYSPNYYLTGDYTITSYIN